MSSLPAPSTSAAERAGTLRQQRELKLGFLIHDGARLRRAAHDAALRPLGLTAAQASLLRHLAHEDGQTQSALAEALELGKVALGETIDRLESRGYVERRSDSHDRRAKRIHLTGAGRDALEGLLTLAFELNAALYAGLDIADLEAAIRVLDTVKHNLLRLTRG